MIARTSEHTADASLLGPLLSRVTIAVVRPRPCAELYDRDYPDVERPRGT